MKRFIFILATAACTQATEAPTPPPSAAEMLKQAMPAPAPSGSISGRLELIPDLARTVTAGEVIFVIARNAATGQTIAVVRLETPETFPLEFELDGSNVMLPGLSLSGRVKLLARIDRDGDAMSKESEDILVGAPPMVDVPAKNVVLKLDKLRG